MKITMILLLVGSLHLSANSYSQSRVSLSMKNSSLEDVLNALEKKTEYTFFYKMEFLKQLEKIDVDVEEKDFNDLLKDILSPLGLTYNIDDKVVIITPEIKVQETKKDVILKGRVLDKDNYAIPGVTILLKGLNMGITSNDNGDFSIIVPNVDELYIVFSFVGMKTQEIKYTGQQYITVIMEEDIENLKEVVVTGYQIIDKSRMAGSVSTIKGEDLFFDGTTSIEQALQGRLPGLVVTNLSGLTGVRQKVRVRGTTTLSGSQDPIWVIDGIIQEDPLPFEATEFNTMGDINESNFDYIRNFVGSSISWLNPHDIESITVLKDASATAIYGVRAANGVIVIQTKLQKGGSGNVTYSFGMNVGERLSYKKLELMNSRDRVAVSREIYERGLIARWTNNNIGYAGLLRQLSNKQINREEFNEGVAQLESTNTDWFDILFRTPFSHNHSISLSGGSEKSTHYASVNYNSVQNTAIGNGQESYTASIGLSNFFNEKLRVSLRLSGSHSITKGFYLINPYGYASKINRVLPAYNEDGSLFFYENEENGYLYNFINERNETGLENKMAGINTNFTLSYDFTKTIRFETSASVNINQTKGESYATEKSNYITSIRKFEYGTEIPTSDKYKNSYLPIGGEYNYDETKSFSWNWRNAISYNTLLKDVHAFTTMLGVELLSTKYTGYSSTVYGYMKYRGKAITQVPLTYTANNSINTTMYNKFKYKITDRITNTLGLYLTLNYSYDKRYVLNFSVRSDASNKFGKFANENFNPVWAGGIRWNVSNERWFYGQNIVSELNMRASLGYQRNMISNYSPSLIVKINTTTTSTTVDLNTNEELLYITKLPYPDLRWEKVLSSNYGIDLGLFNNKVLVGLEYYQKLTKDMITVLDVPLEYGIEGVPINGGNMQNHGFELNASFTPIRTKNFTWSLNVNTSKNFDKITKVGDEVVTTWKTAITGKMYKKGYSSSAFWAFKCTGIDQETGYPIIDLETEPEDDRENDPTTYMKYAGKMDADFTGGISLQFRYKQFSLSTNFNIQIGSKKFLAPAYQTLYLPNEYENLSKQLLERWKPGDTNAKFPGLPDSNVENIMLPGINIGTNVYGLYNYSDARVVSGSTLRCNNISFNYSLPESVSQRMMVKYISMGASVSNPFAIVSKDFKGRDAEVATGNQPRTSSFSFNLNVTF